MKENNKILLLNEKALSHFSYHWFLGLRYYSEPYIENLALYLDNLMQDKEQLNTLKSQQVSVSRLHPLIQFFYWIFNINQYTANTYRLAAMEARVNYQNTFSQGGRMESGYWTEGSPSFPEINEKFAVTWEKHQGPLCHLPLDRSLVKRSGPMSPPQQQHGAKAVKPLIVSEQWQADLHFLGISAALGEEVHWNQIKKAYRKKSLELHPDSPNGSHEKFIELSEVYERLNLYFSGEDISFEALIDLFNEWCQAEQELQEATRREAESRRRAEESRRRAEESGRRAEESGRRAEESRVFRELSEKIADEWEHQQELKQTGQEDKAWLALHEKVKNVLLPLNCDFHLLDPKERQWLDEQLERLVNKNVKDVNETSYFSFFYNSAASLVESASSYLYGDSNDANSPR